MNITFKTLKNFFKRTTVTKKAIIKAIKTEPLLNSGKWAYTEHYDKELEDFSVSTRDQSCTVCVVGSVLRKSLRPQYHLGMVEVIASKVVKYPTTSAISDGPSSFSYNSDSSLSWADQAIEYMLEQGYYLSALSSKFESMADEDKYQKKNSYDPNAKLRRDLAKWVNANLPDSISFNNITSRL